MIEKDFMPHPEEGLLNKFKKFIAKKPAAAAMFGEFESEEDLAARLASENTRGLGTIQAGVLKYEITEAYVQGMCVSNLAASVANGLIQQQESQFGLVIDLHCKADFFARHSAEILRLLHHELIELPKKNY